jgi:hypothetical protein
VDDERLARLDERVNDGRYSCPIGAPDAVDLIAAYRRLKAELRAVAKTLAQALATPDRAERQKLLERAATRAGDGGEGGTSS